MGGGPAGLYLGVLLKLQSAAHRVRVFERNRLEDTFGFGVVFSDQTMENLERADPVTHAQIQRALVHWDAIDVRVKDQILRSCGHGFSGLSRKTLLAILSDRARALGVEIHHEHPVDDIDALLDCDLLVAADGVNSQVRTRYSQRFETEIDWRPNRFVWLGTTLPFEAFTFFFKENTHGLWRSHAYSFEEGLSTFIVETTDETFRRSGLDEVDDEKTRSYVQDLFERELRGHPILTNRSHWRRFPTVTNARWSFDNVVLLGDAAHTAHFSIGSGTKLAMEDAIALAEALAFSSDVPSALGAYEAARRSTVDSTQRAAQVSLEWFERTEEHMQLEPLQFAYSLLTRSLRINHSNLAVREPRLHRPHGRLARRAEPAASAKRIGRPTPPMFLPFEARGLQLQNRVVVSPMCMYSAEDGTVGDWHLVHLGSRAMGGAGLVMTEMTNVSAEARISPGCAGLYEEAHAAAWQRITEFVHRHTPAKIGVQLGHAGRKGSTKRLWEGPDEPLADGGWPLIAPSSIPYRSANPIPREMSRDDMSRVIGDFVRATRLAELADFDLVELHCAHGYLLSSFITPLTNRRDDAYGGTLEKRMRFPLEVFAAVRQAWPAERPISVRISAHDWVGEGGV
ncbi:MAG: bifunctional salicylyl-CoA 5-hydroxylase/oxidoreductase, partial [Myxococcales bacterium]|nr:bifunctional salicylyl-CoA 5-hydroxylase/oxidoreductase [Myxococcales bacterium]